jgi:hypothetical protein
MGGPSQGYETAQNALATATGQQTQIAGTEFAQSQEDRAQRQTLEQPLIAKETALAGGDAKAALSAAAPQIGILAGGYQNAKDQIFNNVPAGPARDYALANLERQKATGISSFMANEVNKAPEILANVGQGLGAFSLQELGGSLSGYSGATTSAGATMQAENSRKEATLGFLGSLAGAAGTAAGGFMAGKR